MFDLSFTNDGLITSSGRYHNNFMIAQGIAKIYGGNYTNNVFTLTKDNFTGAIIGGTANATNVLDVSQLKRKTLFYADNKISTQEILNDRRSSQQISVTNINHFIGRSDKAEHINCQNMNNKMMVDSRGGNNKDSDVINNCRQVVVTGSTKVVSNEPDNTFYIKPSSGYAEIDGKGFIIFSDTALLQEASSISYSAINNTLSFEINFEQNNGRNNNIFTLDIHNYRDGENNYVIVDKYGSVIEPLIQPNSTEVTYFNLKAETNLTTKAKVSERYNEISQANNYTVYGIVKDEAEHYMIFGSKDSDVIPLTENVTFAQGNEEGDIYNLMPDKQVNVTINNYAKDQALDMLYLPVDSIEANKVKNDLYVSTDSYNANIQIENYFKNSSYRHLTVTDQNKNTFLPWLNNQSKVKLIPFFHATEDQYMFLLSAEKVASNPEVIVDAKLEDIRFYRNGNDLMLVDDKPLIVKLENFYNSHGNLTLNFWHNNHKDKLNSKQLSELAKLAINYQDEIKSTYYENVREYVNPYHIHHNQKFVNGSLTTVEPSDRRIGVLVLQGDIAPSSVKVSANNNNLMFFSAQNNATIKS